RRPDVTLSFCVGLCSLGNADRGLGHHRGRLANDIDGKRRTERTGQQNREKPDSYPSPDDRASLAFARVEREFVARVGQPCHSFDGWTPYQRGWSSIVPASCYSPSILSVERGTIGHQPIRFQPVSSSQGRRRGPFCPLIARDV